VVLRFENYVLNYILLNQLFDRNNTLMLVLMVVKL
jgi:hypothetical protein